MTPTGDSSSDKTLSSPAPAVSAPLAHVSSMHALPVGYRLGELLIERVLGEGGFGIVYLAHDVQLGRRVALKEYMPGSLAGRGQDHSVAVRSEHDRPTFELGLRSFINEARLLAQLDHPALVKVHRFWEERGTAYMVMPFYEGQTLRQSLRAPPTAPDEAWLRALLAPLLDVLAYLHSQNIYHRDVSPENILLLPDGRPVLLDFGAARLIIGDAAQNLTAILKQGYAPVEQYAESGATKQGAWTDIYALAAVLYFVVGGKAPTPSVARLMHDDMPSAVQVGRGRYSPALLGWIDACLAVRPEQRPRDVAAARRLLSEPGERTEMVERSTAHLDPVLAAIPATTVAAGELLPPQTRWGWASVAFAMAVGLIVVAWFTGKLTVPPLRSVPDAAPAAPIFVTPVPMPAPLPAAEQAPVALPAVPPQADASLERPVRRAEPVVASSPAAGKTQPGAPAVPRVESRQTAQCADLLQRLSLGEDSAALRQKLGALQCR